MSSYSSGRFGAVVLLALVALLVAACGGRSGASASPANPRVRVAVNADPAYTPYFVALDQGLFKQQGLDVEETFFSNGGDMADAVIAGEMDFTGSGSGTLLPRVATGNFLILGAIATSGTTFKMVARNDLQRPADFVGKRLGVVAGTTPEYAWAIFLQKHNIAPDAVQMVNAPPAELISALDRGEVDAVYIWEPWPTKAVEVSRGQVRVFQTTQDLGYVVYIGVGGNTKFIRDNPDTTVKFLRGVRAAIDFINQHPDQAVAILADRMKQTPDQVRPLFQDYQFAMATPPEQLRDFQDTAAWMKSRGRLQTDIDWSRAIDGSYMQRALGS